MLNERLLCALNAQLADKPIYQAVKTARKCTKSTRKIIKMSFNLLHLAGWRLGCMGQRGGASAYRLESDNVLSMASVKCCHNLSNGQLIFRNIIKIAVIE